MVFFDNIIFSLQRAGGISVVWSELIKRMLNANIPIKCIEYPSLNNICRDKLIIPTEKILLKRCFFLWIKRYFRVRLNKPDKFIFHSSYYRVTSNKSAINVTTVHDFTYEYYSAGLKKRIHCWQKYKAVRQSDFIICISENTRRDLLKFVPKVNPDKIRVIYNGVSDSFFPMDLGSSRLPFEPFSFVLFVGARGGYKNFKFAVDALQGTNYKLVIVGSQLREDEIDFLNKTMGEDNYVALKYVSDEYLNVLYNAAYCLLYPSAYEGFGIPVLEAQKAGCPVIAYNKSSIPEVIGTTPLLFDNLDKNEVLERLNMLRDQEVRGKIIEVGKINSQRFSWEKMYQDVLSLYEEAMSLAK